MRITIERINQAVHMKAINEEGAVIHVDGAESVGGENKGFRPMQLLLAGLGSCSSIDIISILKKQKQPLEDLKIWVDGEREKDKIPSLYTNIHAHFIFRGNLDEKKVKRAVDLSMKTYCSVTRILEKTAKVTYSFEIV
jgi:putative redox protein